MSKNLWSIETQTIHAGQDPDPATGAVNIPIYATSTYAQSAVGEYPFSDYGRVDNPTRTAFQEALAHLEGAQHGLAFASGLAATDTLLRTLSPGDHIILGTDAYGGTYRLISKILSQFGIAYSSVDQRDLTKLEAAFEPTTKVVWIETPSNPTLQIVDISAVSALARQKGALSVVDNTFATPYLQRPLSLGADVVVHSTTKYIGGHSDVIGGFLALNDDTLAEELKFLQYAVGAVQSPFDSYLLLRGLKTLAVRLDRHTSNALAVASFLETHDQVEKVYYPGLESHAGHDIATQQMSGYGGMVSFVVKGGSQQAHKLVESTELFILAESLGGVESLIEVPAGMTHLSTAGSQLEVNPGLVRASVGIEHIDDLLADLEQALK